MAGQSNLRREIAGLAVALVAAGAACAARLDDARSVDVVALFATTALAGVMPARVLAAGRRPQGR